MSSAASPACDCGPLGRFFSSTLGKKAIMAVTGFVMFGFVVGHLVGNLQVFAGDGGVKLDAYAHFLKTTPALLWGTRIVVGLSLVLHVWAAATLKRLSNEARPVAYKMRKDVQASVPSRNMFWGGITLFFYVVYHLLHFTIGVASPIAGTFNPDKVYANMITSFQVGQPPLRDEAGQPGQQAEVHGDRGGHRPGGRRGGGHAGRSSATR
jgi:succinate dehydrogenase / fumarate reductase cytochrome b subunit